MTPPAGELPVTWRPRRGRIIPYVMAGVVAFGAILLAVMVAPPFQLADRTGLVVLGLVMAWVLHLLGRCRVSADERGLTVVNVVRTHRYEWAEVLGVTMEVGDSWPTLDLADGFTLGAMGIQSADGDHAKRAVAELRALIHERGEAREP